MVRLSRILFGVWSMDQKAKKVWLGIVNTDECNVSRFPGFPVMHQIQKENINLIVLNVLCDYFLTSYADSLREEY